MDSRDQSLHTLTKPADKRVQQRGIPPLVIEWLEDYGTVVHDHGGAVVRFFDRTAKRRLERA
jgi:hypothetical protein